MVTPGFSWAGFVFIILVEGGTVCPERFGYLCKFAMEFIADFGVWWRRRLIASYLVLLVKLPIAKALISSSTN
jgi:hypothetical protein